MKKPYRYALAAALLAGSAAALAQEAPAQPPSAPEAAAPVAPAEKAAVEKAAAEKAAAEKAAAEKAAAAKAAAEEPKTGVVVTSEDASARCMLPLVLTAVDGKPIAEGQPSDRFEFEPGEHSFTGYGAGDPGKCATFAAEGGLPLPQGKIGESTVKVNVEAGKEYYLGIDVRSKDSSRWKAVVWKLKH